jgi:hypothetical protein
MTEPILLDLAEAKTIRATERGMHPQSKPSWISGASALLERHEKLGRDRASRYSCVSTKT